MQTTEEGEYIPSKELDKTYKIPKRKDNPATVPVPSQVLEYSDYNYINYNATPEVASTPPMDPARNLIVQALNRQPQEKPKTYSNHVLMETIPDCFDDTLPRELVQLFQPLYCKLCSAQLSSNIVARLHYKSKNHEKKIRKFLIEHSQKSGEPLHKRARLDHMPVAKTSGDEAPNPLHYYCDVCDLPLTGKMHAESHYMGKNHRKAILGVKSPAGKGHYDASGKWIRESQKRPLSSSEDGFGTDFRSTPITTSVSDFIDDQSSSSVTSTVVQSGSAFRCDLCNVTTTCLDQLESHRNGQKHRKRQKQATLDSDVNCQPNDTILSSVLGNGGGAGSKDDCSVYRTPSGSYYCHVCNTSHNSESQLRHHLQGKNHAKKASAQKRA